jgi:hypothetical protein
MMVLESSEYLSNFRRPWYYVHGRIDHYTHHGTALKHTSMPLLLQQKPFYLLLRATGMHSGITGGDDRLLSQIVETIFSRRPFLPGPSARRARSDQIHKGTRLLVGFCSVADSRRAPSCWHLRSSRDQAPKLLLSVCAPGPATGATTGPTPTYPCMTPCI